MAYWPTVGRDGPQRQPSDGRWPPATKVVRSRVAIDRRPWTQAHHVHAWADRGTTDLDNLTLVCGYRHRYHGKLGWSCRMIDKAPGWIPPRWIDAEQRPRRNTANHPPLALAVHDAPFVTTEG